MPTKRAPAAIVSLAAAYARAVDSGDWAVARRALSPVCVREAGDRVQSGADAILAVLAYRAQRLQRAFDDVRRESEVEEAAPGVATVTFTEYLIKAPGQSHRHRWREELRADATPAIARIVVHEPHGERQALAEFYARCGIEPE